ERETVEVTLGRMGDVSGGTQEETRQQAGGGPLGLEVRDLSPEIRGQLEIPQDIDGVVITGVARGSPAARAAISPRNVIVDINGRPVEDTSEYRKIASQLESGTVANLRVYVPQAGVERFVSIRIP
ncbi:MAG: PDZ domain-containing protein, partial [Gemmatimonadota bacterium]